MNEYIFIHKQFDKTKQVEHMVLENTPPVHKQKKIKYLYLTLQLIYYLKYLL